MKAIISHDVDHITVWEHCCDLIIPKHIARNSIELLSGFISVNEYFLRTADIFKNKWQNISELIQFNQEMGVIPTWFVGVNNGKGLMYSIRNAEKWIYIIKSHFMNIGVHGINYSGLEGIKKEHDLFEELYKNDVFGIRMHYLRSNENTLKNLSKAGYIFDTTEYVLKNPYKIGNMWEFPLHIMDGYIILGNKSWQCFNFEQIKKRTLERIEEAFKLELKYLNILFHDRYFSNSFKCWKDWYIWLIEWLKTNNIPFTDFISSIKELENNKI